MTYKQALIGKPYAKRVNKVLERLEVRCSECKGCGGWDGDYKNAGNVISTDPLWKEDRHTCQKCKGTGKIPYSWTPQVGEWCIIYSKAYLITEVSGRNGIEIAGSVLQIYDRPLEWGDATPILDWQTIEEILEKAGYEVWIYGENKYGCDIISNPGKPNSETFRGLADTRQEAVMKAVLALGEEMKRCGE